MTKDEYNEAAALVVRLRKDLELHTDALKQSNAQCGEYLRQNEQLHSELVNVRAALASVSAERDSLKRTLKEWEDADTAPHARVDPPIRMGLISETGPAVFVRIGAPPTDDIADHVVPPVLPMCTTCHGCGGELVDCACKSGRSCRASGCIRSCSGPGYGRYSSYYGPCKSSTPVRHE